MVHEKMKLKILEKISKDLFLHIDQVFERLIDQSKTTYDLNKIIEYYAQHQCKSIQLISCNKRTSEVVNMKRDIVFIYYNLCCPFYRELGVASFLPKRNRLALSEALNLSQNTIIKYINSAKHHFRFYPEYRELIKSNLEAHLNK